jgi:hypothetical protein
MALANHVHLTLSGGYTFTTPETWQMGINFMLINSTTTPNNQGELPTFTPDPISVHRVESNWTIDSTWHVDMGAGAVFEPDDWLNDQVAATLFGTVFPRCSDKVRLLHIKANPVDHTGHVVGDHFSLLTWTSSFTGGSESGNPMPLENSIAVSWQTPVLGKKGRGRIYTPVPASNSTDSEGLLTSTLQDGLRDDCKAMLEGFALTGTLLNPVWMLPIVCAQDPTTYGVITSVRVGQVIDTQRRRRRSQPEDYHTAAVSY